MRQVPTQTHHYAKKIVSKACFYLHPPFMKGYFCHFAVIFSLFFRNIFVILMAKLGADWN